MTFSINFADNVLTEHMRVIDVKRNLGAGIENITEDKISGGADFIRSRRTQSTIEIEFRTFDDISTARRVLADLTNSVVPQKLIFSDEPNLFYNAIRSGEVNLVENKSKLFATGTITFLVPSGYAESIDTKVLNTINSGRDTGTITHNSDGSVTVEINNNGTLPIHPTINITPTSETGFLALVGENGVLEIGNPDEADTGTAKNQKLVCDMRTQADFEANFLPDTSWPTSWPTNLEGIPLNSIIGWEKDGIRIKKMVNTNLWNGGVLRYEVPKDEAGNYVKDWHAQFNTLFIQERLVQCGRLQVYFADENKQPLACFEVYKGGTGENATLNFWLIGGDRRLKHFKSHTFSATTGKADIKGSPLFGPSRGGQAIIKQGNKISFYWKGAAETYLMNNGPASTKLAYVYVVLAKRHNYQMVKDTSLRSFKVMNLNNEFPVDILNKYQPGDKVTVDMAKSKIFVNDIEANSDFITGSNFFAIPPGKKQKLDLVCSPWTKTPPDIEVSWKERYL
ncbi:distal tail protein Dit [Lactococcus muris]|uniref:distal tail protein Dit n=1 Tax=Lactococcus muris TaxID=2941330 RepID=UPI002300AF60